MTFTITINLWWILIPILSVFILTFLVTLAFALIMCTQAEDKWYTFKNILLSFSGIKLSWHWFLQDILKMHRW